MTSSSSPQLLRISEGLLTLYHLDIRLPLKEHKICCESSKGLHILSLLTRSQCAFGRSCDRPSSLRFSWLSSVLKRMLSWFASSNSLLFTSHVNSSNLNFSKIYPSVVKALKLYFQIMKLLINPLKTEFLLNNI
jgi:hypothetical protein